MYVYVIRNSVTGKVYIGQHKGNNLRQYLQKKFYDAIKKRGGQSRLYNSMRKHPREAWSIEPLFEGVETREELNHLERLLIALYDSCNPELGYNICRGGEGFTGTHSEEARRKISAIHLGRKKSFEEIANHKAAMNSKETRRKMRVAKLGKKRSSEAIANMCTAQRRLSHPQLKPMPVKEMSGVIIHGIEIISKVGSTKLKKVIWLCRCHCGNIFNAEGTNLRSGNTKSCGCGKKAQAGANIKDMTGLVINDATVLKRVKSDKLGNALWLCRCRCGNEFTTRGTYLRNGHTRSCGCL